MSNFQDLNRYKTCKEIYDMLAEVHTINTSDRNLKSHFQKLVSIGYITNAQYVLLEKGVLQRRDTTKIEYEYQEEKAIGDY